MSIRNRMKLEQLKGGTLTVADASANAMDIVSDGKTYLKVVTTNSGELIELGDGNAGVKLEGGLSGTSFKNENNMASNSATAVASQASIKAYVDGQVAAVDLTMGIGADSGADSTVSTAETLTIAGDTGITLSLIHI